MSIVWTDDRTIARLAGLYRGRAHATDVLAFPLDDALDDLAGEVIVSLDTARRQARERGVKLAHELLLLAVHGLLHLQGYRDGTRRDWLRMKQAEFETMMRILGVPS